METKQRKSTHILLVDDERVALAVIRNGLTVAGYRCSIAESVDEAAKLLRNALQPDIVVLDVGMPNKSGLVLAEYLASLSIPFIMLTAFSDQATIDQATQFGALGYLVKPITIKQLIPAIDAALVRAEEMQQLKLTESQLKTALNGDRDISIAIGITMAKFGVDRDTAFNQLRASARQQSKKLAVLAKEVLNHAELSKVSENVSVKNK